MNKELIEKVTEMMHPHPVYLVGGAVRDYIMGNEPKDYDFCTPATPDEIEKCIKDENRRAYLTGKRFGTLACKIDGEMVEITTFRTETYEPGNRKPEVEYVNSITADLSRRDFTMNAMAIRFTKGHLKIIDPFEGEEDIQRKVIKTVGFAKQRFKEDPLRILRAIRFAAKYGFEIEEQTLKKLKKMTPHLIDISKERWMIEFDKILTSTYTTIGLQLCWENEVFKWTIPELQMQYNYEQNSKYHDYTLHQHTKMVVNECPKELNMRWAALFHDIAKPFVRTDKEITVTAKTEYSDFEMNEIKSNYIGHEILGAEMVLKYASYLKWSNDRKNTVYWLVRDHLEDGSKLRQYDNMCKKKQKDNDEPKKETKTD